MDEIIINNLGSNIHYWYKSRVGNEFLFFLHGAGVDHEMFDLQFSAMPEKYNIIAWDARGHGKSDIEKSVKFNYLDMIKDVLVICEKHNIKSAIFIGQSMGGNLCQDLAYFCPEKVKSLILIDCTRNTSKLNAIEKFQLKISSFILKIYPTKTLINQSAEICGKTEYTKKYVKRLFNQIGKDRFIEIMNSLKQALHENENYKFHCPVLLICGKDDKSGNIMKVMSNWSVRDNSCTFVCIDDAGHCANQDKPLEVNNAINNFLNNF